MRKITMRYLTFCLFLCVSASAWAGGNGTVTATTTNPFTSGTIVFPAAAVDRQIIKIISINNGITGLALTPTAGTTILGSVGALTANVPVSWQYTLSCTCYVPD
jgi:Na+/H+ antiporter NhaC